MPRKIPSRFGLALTNLLKGRGWAAKELAAAAGVSPSTISAYETGDLALGRERLEALAGLMGQGSEEVERAVFAASLVLPLPTASWTPVDPTPEQFHVIERAAAMAGGDAWDLVRETLIREVREGNAKPALEEGRELEKQLRRYSEADQRDLIEGAPDFQKWSLAVALCAESERAAADRPEKALKLAELSLFVAGHVPGTDAWRSRLQGYCTGFIANAQRVGSKLRAAEATFVRAWRLWRAGEDEAGLLSEAYLLDLEASLRRAQRLFPQALQLHHDALSVARSEEVGSILLNQSATLEQKGDHEASLEVLDQAAQVIDGERQPRLRFGLRFNQAANLCRLGRVKEAALIVPEVRILAERLRNALDLVRTLWLEGSVTAGLGRRNEARAQLEQVRRDFEDRGLPYDYALVSLDVAMLYREERRFPEIKALAGEILKIFNAQGVHREAIAAIVLFREAAEKEQVTAELLRRLQGYLTEVQKNPHLRFEAYEARLAP